MERFKMGFFGFGEAASIFAEGLHNNWPEMELTAYDKFINEKTVERADKAGVNLVSSLEELVGKVDVVGSLVTGSTSLQAAREICGMMRQRQLYIDFNSISPRVKIEIGKVFEEAGIPMVDAAVMGSIPENGLNVSILISGKEAEYASEGMNGLGFKTSVVGEKAGEAAAIKMVRSIFAKGMEGLFIEMLLAGKKYGVEEYVIDSVAKSLENKKIRDVMNTLVVSQAYHSARKESEMDFVIEVLKDVNIEPVMSTATRDCFKWLSGLNLKQHINPDTATYQDVIEAIENQMG